MTSPDHPVAAARAEAAATSAAAAAAPAAATSAAAAAAPAAATSAATLADLTALVEGRTSDPHAILGAHELARPGADPVTVVRTLRHGAETVTLVAEDGTETPLPHRYSGVFEASVAGTVGDYRLRVTYPGGTTSTVDDPYRWLPTVGEVDQHLIREGRHEQLWRVLGAHVRRYETPAGPVDGTSFAVWAPNAVGVRLAGDFNHWTGEGHPMRELGSSGVWELFVPGIGVGAHYKFRILGRDGRWREKADPMAFAAELPPATASVVTDQEHQWGDGQWLADRAGRPWADQPLSIYEVHAGSWRPGLTYRTLADELIAHLDDTGFTHVEFLPLAGHPFAGSWGYQVTSYYAVDARLGSPDDFRYLVDRLHQAGYGVILDWVPAHFPRDEWALADFDGTPLYEHPDPQRGQQPDWGTLMFNFGRAEVRNFLVANALFWIDEFHVDGLRVDAVAAMLYLDYSREPGEWTPNQFGGNENLDAVQFLQETTATVGKHHPSVILIAEESTSWPGVTRPTDAGGLGFGLKWNMGWMHDTLSYIGREPVHRAWHHHDMTFAMMYAYSEQFVLPLSHDEVVHGKGSLWGRIPGDDWQKAATLRAYFAFQWAHPGKKLLFMGGEFGDPSEWNASATLPWQLLDNPLHRGLKDLIGDVNRTYRATPALYTQDFVPAGFDWIAADDSAGNVYSFIRRGRDGSPLVCVANFSAIPHEGYRIGLPLVGRWSEVLNTDAHVYGGSGVGNLGFVNATADPLHGQPASAPLTLPPLGALWLTPDELP